MLGDIFNDFLEQDQFYHVLQPIYGINNMQILGYEALLRSDIGTPDILFQMAKDYNCIFDLDICSIRKALATISSVSSTIKDELIFINIFPSTVINFRFPKILMELLEEYPFLKTNVVFELNETEKSDTELVQRGVKALKDSGLQIAIDDIGKGWSSLSGIIEIEPKFIKLDLYFSKSLAQSPKKQMMIKVLVNYCEMNDIQIILEGIETAQDLHIAKSLGVPFGQGYLLCKPQLIENIIG